MRERPILFCGDMVRAILAGTKTQTRRVMKLQPSCSPELRIDPKWGVVAEWPGESEFDGFDCHCPYGQPGDRLWVREAWTLAAKERHDQFGDGSRIWPETMSRPHVQWYGNAVLNVIYRADGEHVASDGEREHWHPGIHMERKASRLTLDVTEVRVQRLHDISEDDAKAEGVEMSPLLSATTPFRSAFIQLWESINSARGFGWDENPWVWAVTFRRVANG